MVDGHRQYYPNGGVVAGGTVDSKLTPVNSDGGTVPATITTDASGAATFNLTYTKTSAFHIWTRIRASTLVQGTETVGQTDFVLPAMDSDVTPTCLLPASPWAF